MRNHTGNLMMRLSLLARNLVCGASSLALVVGSLAPAAQADKPTVVLGQNDGNTTTPIKHVIVIYGENRSFDHLFATYTSPSGDKVLNALSQGIVNANGTPGPHFALATQFRGIDTSTYSISPQKGGAYDVLPPPGTGSAATAVSDTNPPPFATRSAAASADQGVPNRSIRLLTTGATGLPKNSVDTRVKNATTLPPGPFQYTPAVSYDDYAASPVHRYYQARQQSDCSAATATKDDPSGCLNDLFPWVEVTIGAGSNGNPQPASFNDLSTGEGSTSMGFYNVQDGDMPYFKKLADEYTISDNYHQPGMGGTGLSSYLAGFADGLWYSDGNGNPETPPANQIENPNPQPGTNNYYAQDGYSGGSYSACADTAQPGVGSVVSYLEQMKINPNCEPGHYYLLNNYNPGYLGNGTVNTTSQFTIPPVSTPSIGDVMLKSKVSFRWYGEGWTNYVSNPNSPNNVYCNICNPFQYETSIMANPTLRETVIQDLPALYNDVRDGTLPAVSFVKPGSLNDGHPASSKFDIYEAFVRKIIQEVQANPTLWKETAIFITTDEAGGYWDSGYIQPLDFFGDGPRIMMIAVSPYSTGGHVSHTYSDHVSILKFVEANWNLPKISSRSRDNLPNPKQNRGHPYAPINSPAIGDMMDMFRF
jgi:phospholipase C